MLFNLSYDLKHVTWKVGIKSCQKGEEAFFREWNKRGSNEQIETEGVLVSSVAE